MGELWQWRDVTVRGVHAPRLDRVSLRIDEGITAVLGWSGAGKSTLLNILVGFEKPSSGSVSVPPAAGDARPALFWVPQEEGLWAHLCVQEHLRTVAPPTLDAAPLLTMFGLTALIDRLPDQLSVGERSRLSVARALASDAAVLVMDEPLSHVDRPRADVCWDALMAHVRRTDTSLIYATHSPRTVLGYADCVIFLSQGRVCYSGSVDDLYWHPATRELGECLGPANWFTPDEAVLWLGRTTENPILGRPARTCLHPVDEGPIAVTRVHVSGDTVVVELKHDDGASRKIVSTLVSYVPRTGDRVALAVEGKPCL